MNKLLISKGKTYSNNSIDEYARAYNTRSKRLKQEGFETTAQIPQKDSKAY